MTAALHIVPMGASPALSSVGVHRGIPMDVYHALPYVSNSRLNHLRRSPAHLQAYLTQPHADTKATRIGRATHTTILEPELFDSTFKIAGQCMALTQKKERCTKMGTQYYGDLLGWRCSTEAHYRDLPKPDAELLALPESEYVDCLSMRNAVFAHPKAGPFFARRSDVELTLIWDDPETGVRCKARADFLAPSLPGGAIGDLKTTLDARKPAFALSMYKHGYYRQGAFYLDGAAALGIPAEHFVIVAIEKAAPFAVKVYRLTEGALTAGRQETRALLTRYAECRTRNLWPAYDTDIEDLTLPDFAWSQLDELLEVA